ncbi:MAG: CsbD family protein [Terriglobales bacterium]|jgi:uncharacterized protein YjbJ (UPF0337 family)
MLKEKKWRNGMRQLGSGHRAETQRNLLIRRIRRKNMKASTQDRTEGKIHEVKGKIKEEVGKATDDSDLEVSGNVEKNAGKVQNLIGRVEKAVDQ